MSRSEVTSRIQAVTWNHSVRYGADSACKHCQGVIHHEFWCVEESKAVAYAYRIVLHPESLSISDRLILHALGVTWSSCR